MRCDVGSVSGMKRVRWLWIPAGLWLAMREVRRGLISRNERVWIVVADGGRDERDGWLWRVVSRVEMIADTPVSSDS